LISLKNIDEMTKEELKEALTIAQEELNEIKVYLRQKGYSPPMIVYHKIDREKRIDAITRRLESFE